MRNICVRDAPCWDPNVLNAPCTNCYCERLFTSAAKLQLTLPVRGFERRMRIQIHFPVPKCLCKQGTKNVFNNITQFNFVEQEVSNKVLCTRQTEQCNL